MSINEKSPKAQASKMSVAQQPQSDAQEPLSDLESCTYPGHERFLHTYSAMPSKADFYVPGHLVKSATGEADAVAAAQSRASAEEATQAAALEQSLNQKTECQRRYSFRGSHMPSYFLFDYGSDRYLLDEGSCYLLGITYTGDWIPGEFIEKQIHILEDEQYFNILFTTEAGNHIFTTIRINQGVNEGDLLYMTGSVVQRDNTGIALIIAGYFSQVQANFLDYMSRVKQQSSAFDIDTSTGDIHFGVAYKEMLGYKDYSELPKNVAELERDLIHPDDLPVYRKQSEVIASPDLGYYYETIYRIKHQGGYYIWCIDRGLVVERNRYGRATRIIGTTTNIDILRSNFERLKRSIYQDPLTGLHNRLYLNTRYKYFTMEESQPLSLVYADISGLKLINDYLGHAQGDVLVKLAAQVLQNDVFMDHEVVRLSGDEFLLIFNNCSAVQCKILVNKFVVALSERNRLQEFPLPVIFGFGIATLNEIEDGDTFIRCEARADARLQEYKIAHHDHIYSILRAFLETALGHDIDLTDNRRLDYLGEEAKVPQPEVPAEKPKKAKSAQDEVAAALAQIDSLMGGGEKSKTSEREKVDLGRDNPYCNEDSCPVLDMDVPKQNTMSSFLQDEGMLHTTSVIEEDDLSLCDVVEHVIVEAAEEAALEEDEYVRKSLQIPEDFVASSNVKKSKCR